MPETDWASHMATTWNQVELNLIGPCVDAYAKQVFGLSPSVERSNWSTGRKVALYLVTASPRHEGSNQWVTANALSDD